MKLNLMHNEIIQTLKNLTHRPELMVEHCDVNAMQMPSVKTINLKSWHALLVQSLVTSLVIALNL